MQPSRFPLTLAAAQCSIAASSRTRMSSPSPRAAVSGDNAARPDAAIVSIGETLSCGAWRIKRADGIAGSKHRVRRGKDDDRISVSHKHRCVGTGDKGASQQSQARPYTQSQAIRSSCDRLNPTVATGPRPVARHCARPTSPAISNKWDAEHDLQEGRDNNGPATNLRAHPQCRARSSSRRNSRCRGSSGTLESTLCGHVHLGFGSRLRVDDHRLQLVQPRGSIEAVRQTAGLQATARRTDRCRRPVPASLAGRSAPTRSRRCLRSCLQGEPQRSVDPASPPTTDLEPAPDASRRTRSVVAGARLPAANPS